MTAPAASTPSLDPLVELLYRSISGPAGAPRDWGALEAVLLPGARLTRMSPNADGTWDAEVMSIAEYRATRAPLFETKPFVEFETRRVTDVRGPLANVFSWFTARATPGGADLLRGVNAIQLVQLHAEWRVAAISWYREFDVAESHGYVPVTTAEG
jgi:hypothetical protein